MSYNDNTIVFNVLSPLKPAVVASAIDTENVSAALASRTRSRHCPSGSLDVTRAQGILHRTYCLVKLETLLII